MFMRNFLILTQSTSKTQKSTFLVCVSLDQLVAQYDIKTAVP